MQVYAPGCALMIYRPELAGRVLAHLNADGPSVTQHLTCCRHSPQLPEGTEIINTCPGCDRRYRELYDGITTVSLWELLAGTTTFPFPDYRGLEMTVQDACPTRTEERVHAAVRRLLARMHIQVVEPRFTKTHAVCCGDTFFGVLPIELVKQQMAARAAQMPRDDVVVYCVSCVKALHLGGRRPRHLLDLLFGEDTTPGPCQPDGWHAEIQAYIDSH